MKGISEKYPEGHFLGKWMGIGIAVFTGIGIPLCFALKNPGLIGIWPALGVAFGVAIGHAIETKHKQQGEIRPLTEKEKKRRKMLVTAGLMIFALLFLIFLFKYLFRMTRL